MGKRIAVLAVLLAACNEAPVVEIAAPLDGALIDDHAPVVFDILVTDENLAAVALQLDGLDMDFTADPPLPADGDCEGGCAMTLTWSGAEASEGTHVLSVLAYDQDDELDQADVSMTFEDTPTVTVVSPASIDQLGVQVVQVQAVIVDRSDVTAELRLDGEVVPATVHGDCRFGCDLAYEWDTTGFEGGHTFTIGAADPFGRLGAATTSMNVGDMPYATSIEITGETDNIGFGSLEVEVHLFDADTGAFLGCSGEHSGMEGVDESNERYPVLAWFQDRLGDRVPMSTLAGRNIRVQVIEDDAFPCPESADLGADDPVGSATGIPAASLATMDPMTFENVVYLELTAGRPY
jgi:hypothetical protein